MFLHKNPPFSQEKGGFFVYYLYCIHFFDLDRAMAAIRAQ
jgi:hypothetical protein